MEQHEDIPWHRKSNHEAYNIRRKPVAPNTFSYKSMYLETSSGTATNHGIWRPREETNTSTNGLLETRANAKIAANDKENNIKECAGRAPSWRPAWLRPLVLALFASLFVFLSMALAAMLWYSNTNNGLFESRQSLLHTYLWRFVPTAFLTILTIFWARVELQAMMYMPWISPRSGFSLGERDLALDYTTMFLPLVFPRSFRQKHYLVFMVASISTLLKAQVILVPGLYSLVELQIISPVDIFLQDTFDLNLITDATYALDPTPYYLARAQNDFDVVQPYGVAEGFAYQTFFTGNDLGRGTVANPVTATVDGIFTDTECLKLSSYSIVEQHNIDNIEGRGYPEMNFTVALQFDGCEEPILFVHNWAWQEPELGPYTDWVMEGDQKVQRPCSGLPLQAPAFIYYNGAFTLEGDESSPLAEYHSAAGVICEPHAWLSKVRVTDDGVKPKVMAVSDERQILSTPNIWTMINMSLPTGVRWTGRILADLGPVSVDLDFRGYTRADWPKNITTDMLQGSAQNLTHRLAPFVNHRRVRQKKSSTGSGTLLQHVVRLTVNPKICLSMIVLFVLSAGITAFLLWHYYRDTSIWHRDPATLLGNSMFLSAHPDLTCRAAEINGVASGWHHGAFTPLVLKTIPRVVFCIFTILLAGSLILTLRHSETSDGLATIGEDGYLHLMWTSFPATIALGVSLYISSCDWSYRDLATIYHLSRATCTSSDLDRSLLDMLGLRALFYSFRYRLWSVTFSQSLALVCGLLTSLVSIIFTLEVIPGSTPTQFQQQTWFQLWPEKWDQTYEMKQKTFSSLWTLQEDTKLTYPKNTFDDLVFHDFESINNLDPSKNISVAITTPARKVEFQCTRMSEERYHLSHHKLVSTGQLTRFYGTIGVDFECPERGTTFTSRGELDLGENDQAHLFQPRYFSSRLSYVSNPCDPSLNTQANYTTALYPTFVWGQFDPVLDDYTFVTVYHCEQFWVEVDTEINLVFSDGHLAIDTERPPRPDMSTMRPLDPPLDMPPWPFMAPDAGIADEPSAALGDPEQEKDVLQYWLHNYTRSAAQLANVMNRKPISAQGGPSPAPIINATVWDNGRRRLVQNPTITYVVVGILGGVILFNIWTLTSALIRRCGGGDSWLLDMDARGLAPDGFHSIAAAAGLLRDSNVAAHLPPGAEMMSLAELHGRMTGIGFRLGWFRRECDQTRHYTVGVMDDPEFNYMGVRRSSKRAFEGVSSKESVAT